MKQKQKKEEKEKERKREREKSCDDNNIEKINKQIII